MTMRNTESNMLEITGMSNNATEYMEETEEVTETETETETETHNNECNIAQNTDNEQNEADEQYNNDISIENQRPEDIHVTINDMNTIHEMNAGQLHIDPNAREAIEEETATPTHGYNICPRPTRRNQKYNMINIGQQSTIAKAHLHVMLNQVGIREGIKMFGEKAIMHY